MRRIVFSIVFLALLTFLGCGLYSEDIESLLIYSQGPRDEYPVRGYEIDFFSDGMIKRIRQFRLSGIVDPYRWSDSENLRTYVSEYITERNGNEVTQYQIQSQGERELHSTYKINIDKTIDYNRTGSDYKIDYKNISEILYYRGNGTLISSVKNVVSGIATINALSDTQFLYRIKDAQLQELLYEGQGIKWSAGIKFDGRNIYTIVVPDHVQEFSYAEKVTVVLPRIIDFAFESTVLNRFILNCINSGETRFLVPFVMQRLIP